MLWIIFSVLSVALRVTAKPADIALEVPWRAPSDDVLALETLARYNSSAFFPMLSTLLTERINSDDSSKPVDLFSLAVKSQFLKESAVDLVKQEVSVGRGLAFFESHYQEFESMVDFEKFKNSPVVVWIEGSCTDDITDLFALQTPSSPMTPTLLSTDRVIGTGPQWIIVYADLDSPDFPDWHSVLLEMGLSGKITYVLRNRPPVNEGSEPIKLAGYGVGFHLKKTDYLVVDDRQVDGELDIKMDSLHQVPVTKLPYLGFSAATKIRSAKDANEKLNLLKDFSYNFPQHAVDLADEATEELASNEKTSNKLGASGLNGIFINGEVFRARNVFDFYDELHHQLDLLYGLEDYVPANANITKILTTGIALDDYDDAAGEITRPKQRYDLRASASAIGWINDIEKDDLFQTLEDDLDLLKSLKGPFIPLRRNMHSVVVAGDLRDTRTLVLLKGLLQQTGQYLPLQIGLVATNPEWQQVAKLGSEIRQAFLIQAVLGTPLHEAEQSAMELHDDSGSGFQKQLSDPLEWLQRFGVEEAIKKEPVLFVNGIPLTLATWQEMAPFIFASDFSYIQEMADKMDPNYSLRDILFATGLPERNKLLDPIEDVVFSTWPVNSPIQSFKNPNPVDDSTKKHSILLSSSFKTRGSFDLADALLARSMEKKDVDVFIRPLAGIDERFYAAMVDPTYNMFRFSRDLFQSVRAHFFERKTAPKVLSAAKEPNTLASDLPTEMESIIIDGRLLNIHQQEISEDLLHLLIDRESSRLERIVREVPNLSGLGVAALSAISQGRTVVTSDDEKADISFKRGKNLLVTAIIDPATSEGQILTAFADIAVNSGFDVDIIISPSEISEMPSRIFQPVLDRSSGAVFNNLSDDVLYSVELVEPPAWITTTSKCDYDLDNVILNTVKEDKFEALYTLRGLLVHGFAMGGDSPGTPLYLRNSNGTRLSDTVVMTNLGYFQLTAPVPGIYDICVDDPNFSLKNVAGPVDCVSISVVDATGTGVKLEIVNTPPQHFVGSKPKKEEKSVWNKFKGIVGSTEVTEAPQADINIFTVASGHLYERFASIMMLSVMRHTEHTVKFWLIENFMSPKFKEFVPVLAEKYGFDFEFVSYKWPPWLRSQIEKQRQIWGYKMLFLDVLFPQSLTNIIFVDSDQIVRTDFKELLDIDLHDAPYAFAPMGDDREEMEPYRFWKQGFWKKALIDEGYQYHISALYRVDLKKFRELKAGDIIRQQYQRLSANPENLANLDQDLPNSLQQVIPIHSLSKEWLWCETWCSDEGLASAKTIDLCNNPLTKEPKLDRAHRQIPEWTEYDGLIAELAKSLETEQNAKLASSLSSKTESTKSPESSKQAGATQDYYERHPNEHIFVDDDIIHDEL